MNIESQIANPHSNSLEDIHGSVRIPHSWWRRFLAFSGPALLVSVGYMDPGNWGTDLEAGSKFGYRLMWVLLLSNLMALLLQTLATRLGVVSGRDLAQACRESYPRRAVWALWILCEIAIAACDLAEVIGTVIALNLLFGLPYLGGLVVAAADTFLLLAVQRRGVRLLELLTLTLVAVIAGSFCVEIVLARPDWAAVIRGFIPGLDAEQPHESLYVAIGILGATVMPHNLYLHSALVQTRAFSHTTAGKQLACRYNFFDSLLALNGAFFVNAAILVLSVAAFYGKDLEVDELTLQRAHELLGKTWGFTLAPILFAVALLASGQSSTLTGTLAGQVVMEGFVKLRLRPAARRLLTRSLAIAPALMAIGFSSWWAGSTDQHLLDLLVLSQVVLSFQLPFAIVPLVQFTSDRRRMGTFANRGWVQALAWGSAALVLALNVILIYQQLEKWAAASQQPLWIYGTFGTLSLGLAGFLSWLVVYPLWAGREEVVPAPSAPVLPGVRYRRIGVAVEFERADGAVLSQAAELARTHGAELVAVHVVEGLGADYYGAATDNQESRADRTRMETLVEHLRQEGLQAEGMLGYGNPAEELVRMAEEQHFDLLVLGTHGHRFLADLALGQTVAPLLHRLAIPILVVPAGTPFTAADNPC
jgi:manganese transport protein